VPRIVHVISVEGTKMGGAARVMMALLEGGRERGWSQMVLNPYASTERGLADHCDGVPYETLTPHSVTAFPRARRWLRRRLAEFEPDIVQVHLLHAMVTVASLPRSTPGATVLTYHHHLHLQSQGRGLGARLDRLAGRRFDKVVAVADAGERFLVSEYGYPRDRVTCIRNGWSGTPLADASEPDVPTVVSVANFRGQKRHDVLIDAFAELLGRVPNARLLLAGDGALAGDAKDRARRRGITERVEFLGAVDNVWPLLARAHVFALTSDYEGLPVALIEAMAAGLPVVATAVEGNTDLVREGRTGLLCPAGDAAACSTELESVLTDASLRERMGAASRDLARGWTMDRSVDRYFELYDDLIRDRG
jgi:glycosyltransferase involved in cell wall biosynthesis